MIAVNLILWFALLGNALVNGEANVFKTDAAVVDGRIILVGVGFAAVMQHIMYHRSRTRKADRSA